MWKRILTKILTVITFLLATALTVCVLLHITVEASAAEISSANQIEENKNTIMENEEVKIQTHEEYYDIIRYQKNLYKIPHLSLNREPGVTESGYVEKYTEVPHYFQSFYPKVRYGDSNIRKSGCGITCVSMVLTYLLDEEVSIEELAQKYSRHKVKFGSSFELFTDSARDYGVTIEKKAWNWEEVMEAMKNGQVAIGRPRTKSIFTDGGHYIVLAGLTEDGKILVRDPNLYNYSIWNYPVREDGYLNGFEEKSLKYHCFPFFIYEKKDLEAVAARTEAEEVNFAETQTNANS